MGTGRTQTRSYVFDIRRTSTTNSLITCDLTSQGPLQAVTLNKGQETVERRYSTVKGPLAVAPMFLQDNRRIAALITVICLALLIFCLAERAVRLANTPATTIDGLQAGRPTKPTGRLIFETLAGLRLIPATATSPAIIPRPNPVQQRLLDLVDIDPTRPP